MGAPDGAELCEFVGLYLLHEVKNGIPDINLGLYRDDGLATHKKTPRTKTGKNPTKPAPNIQQTYTS